MKLFERIRGWLRLSPHVHIREHGVHVLSDVIDLIDRFVDGHMKYELEWDDFISWQHENPNIEELRKRIASMESTMFSNRPSDRLKSIEILLDERNRVAALVGLPARKFERSEFVRQFEERLGKSIDWNS